MIFSLACFALVYLALLVVEVRLLFKFTRGGVPSAMPELLNSGGHDGGSSGGMDSAGGDDGTGSDGSGGGTRAKQPDDVLGFAY